VTTQAPGEVRVSGFAVSYDVPAPTAPAVPATGLCPATPPDVIPGTRPQGSGHCPCCGSERALTQARAAVAGAGRPATVGRCVACGTAIIRIGGAAGATAVPAGPPGRNGGRHDGNGGRGYVTDANLPRVRPATVLPPSPAEDAPASAVRGVGRVRARQLAAAGIATVAGLIAASPEELATALGISKSRVAALLAEADELRALGTRIRWVVPGQGRTPEVRIAAVAGTNADGTPWRLPLGDAAARVMAGTWSFHLARRSGARIPVLAAAGVRGPYLKTAEDGEQPESLLALPIVPHLSSALVSRRVPPTPGRG
jgi:hypothetical protein